MLEDIKKLVSAIDSSAAVDINRVATAISTLTQRLDKLERQRPHVSSNGDIASISERLEKVEADIRSIQSTVADLTARVSAVEGVGYIGNTVTTTTQLASSDIKATTQPPEPTDIISDIEANKESDRTALTPG